MHVLPQAARSAYPHLKDPLGLCAAAYAYTATFGERCVKAIGIFQTQLASITGISSQVAHTTALGFAVILPVIVPYLRNRSICNSCNEVVKQNEKELQKLTQYGLIVP